MLFGLCVALLLLAAGPYLCFVMLCCALWILSSTGIVGEEGPGCFAFRYSFMGCLRYILV